MAPLAFTNFFSLLDFLGCFFLFVGELFCVVGELFGVVGELFF